MIMEREDGLDVLPLSLVRCDASSSLGHWVGDELVYDPQPFGLVQGLGLESFTGLFGWCSGSDAMDPVADSDPPISDCNYTALEVRVLASICTPRQTSARLRQPL